MLYSTSNQQLGTVFTLFQKAWNDGKLPIDTGLHEWISIVDEPVRVLTDGIYYDIDVLCSIRTERNICVKEISFWQISGFRDEVNGTLQLKEATTDVFDLVEVKDNWPKIESFSDLAVTPVLTITIKTVVDYNNLFNPKHQPQS